MWQNWIYKTLEWHSHFQNFFGELFFPQNTFHDKFFYVLAFGYRTTQHWKNYTIAGNRERNVLFWPPFSIHLFPLKPLLVYGRVMTGIVGDVTAVISRCCFGKGDTELFFSRAPRLFLPFDQSSSSSFEALSWPLPSWELIFFSVWICLSCWCKETTMFSQCGNRS